MGDCPFGVFCSSPDGCAGSRCWSGNRSVGGNLQRDLSNVPSGDGKDESGRREKKIIILRNVSGMKRHRTLPGKN